MASAEETISLINLNPTLQQYYNSLESRIGYRLFLGGTRHFGFYDNESSWPFPINRALRAMEEQLFKALNCPPGSRVLDAGCGVGHVAVYMAGRGKFKVEAIDVVSHHVEKARRSIAFANMSKSISVKRGDYHNLEHLDAEAFDGIYTMETLTHATDVKKVLAGFFRLLKPGGRIALHEYDHEDLSNAPQHLSEAMRQVNKFAAMPSNDAFDKGVLEDCLRQAGFEQVQLRDISPHIVPMLWLFYTFAIIPYLIISFLGLERWFVNTLAGVGSYRGRHLWRYVQITGVKPRRLLRSAII